MVTSEKSATKDEKSLHKYQNSYEGRKLPKRYVKFTNFSSIAWIIVGGFSMSFGYKITICSGVMSHQSWKYEKSPFLLGNSQLSNLMSRNSRTTGNFVAKTHWEASYIYVSNWGKSCEFKIMFR